MNKLLLLFTSLAVVATVPAVAAGDKEERGHHGHERPALHDRGDPERQLKRLERVLNLSDRQRQSIKNALLDAEPEMEALHEEMRASRSAMARLDSSSEDDARELATLAEERGRLTSRRALLHGKLRAAINAELTDEQRADLKSSIERRKGRRGERHRHRREGANSGQ